MVNEEEGGKQVWNCPYDQMLSPATVARKVGLSGLNCLGFSLVKLPLGITLPYLD